MITEPWTACALLYPLPEYSTRYSRRCRQCFRWLWFALESRSTLRTVSMQGLLYEWEDKITTIRFYRISESWLLLILHIELTQCVYLAWGTCRSPIVPAMAEAESFTLESLFLPLRWRNITGYGCVWGKSSTKPMGFKNRLIRIRKNFFRILSSFLDIQVFRSATLLRIKVILRGFEVLTTLVDSASNRNEYQEFSWV
jgi:hypothetical protein